VAGRLLGKGAIVTDPTEYSAADIVALFREKGAEVFAEPWDMTKPEMARFYRYSDIRCEPFPVQEPHPPIWVGGHSRAAGMAMARIRSARLLPRLCRLKRCAPHLETLKRLRRLPGRRVVRIGLRVIDRHLAVSVEGNLVRRPPTDNGRPTYRDGSGYAADRPKSRHIGLHGAGTRRPFGEMPPMRPWASIPGSSPGTVGGAPDR
jgi:hypothetical protein